MSTTRSTGVVVMVLAFVLALSTSFELGVSDHVILRNKLQNNKTDIRVVCQAYIDWRSTYHVGPGEETVVAVPYNENLFGWRPSNCVGFWRYAGYVRIYRSYLDHEACKDKCIVEVRDNGSFRWNQTEKAWDLIDKLPHLHPVIN